MIATETQMIELRRHAVNEVTREIMCNGITLNNEQADDLGEETLAWMHGRLGLNIRSNADSVEFFSPRHYAGRDRVEKMG